MQINIHSNSVCAPVKEMFSIHESSQQILTKCSNFKIRDYRNHTKNSIEDLERLISSLETEKSNVYQSLQPLVEIIQKIITSIDRTILWKLKDKANDQQQLVVIVCKLFKCLCQLDAERAANEQGIGIIRAILQWLRDDTDFHLIKSRK